MMVSVAEYAAVAGISERAARLRAEQGRIDASRVGRIWLIPEHELGAAVEGKEPPGPPVSLEAFERLAQLLDGDHAHLNPDQRRQPAGSRPDYCRRTTHGRSRPWAAAEEESLTTSGHHRQTWTLYDRTRLSNQPGSATPVSSSCQPTA